jgi:UDP:flavonoid glycosyltransferase YjiC (YdhE family)
MAHYLLTPFGSAGDVNPFLWLGRLLQARGHDVEMLTAPMFQDYAEKCGIAFTSLGDAEEFDRILHHPDLWKPYRGTALVFEYSAKFLRRSYDLIAARMRVHDTVLVSPFHQFASRLAREKFAVPLVNVHLQPACFLSLYDTPLLLPGTEWFLKMPHRVKRFILSLPNPAASSLAPTLRRVCRDLGVSPPRRVIPDWMHSPDANLALFPEWFAPPQPDWPAHTHTVGFPLEDMKEQIPIPAELDAWLEQGDKPVLFSPGTGNTQAREFFSQGMAACERLGLRALLGTRFPEQLPDPLPPHARHFDYLPFSALLPRVCAFVHHGGIGTMSQAFAAGVPQLVMPMGHDQPDNARRLKQLGAGHALSPKKFTADRVAECLRRLISSPEVAAACAKVKTLCKAMNAADNAIAALEHAVQCRV